MQPVQRVSLGASGIAGDLSAISAAPAPIRRSRVYSYGGPAQDTLAVMQPSVSPEGFRVDHVEVPYNPSDTDHIKMKPLQSGGDQQYQFSSPFGFSQGEGPGATAPSSAPSSAPAPAQVTVNVSAQLGWSEQLVERPPEVGPVTMYAEIVSSSTSVQDSTPNVQGFGQQFSSIQWRPPPMQQYGAPPYPQQQWQPYPQQPMYGGYAAPPPQQPQQPQWQPMQAGPLEGWLAKRSDGGVGSAWNLRWWVLNGTILSYSRDERGAEHGRILMSGKTEVRPLNHPQATVDARVMSAKYPCAFEIFQGVGQRTYYLDAGSMEKRNLWIDRLSQAVASLRQSAWPHGAPPGGFR